MGERPRLLRRLLVPTLYDCLLVSLLAWQFAAGGRWITLLADGDTGWHIRTGQHILENLRWPHADLFSFSKPNQPWYAWEWLADVVLAFIHRCAGLSGVVVAAALVLVVSAALVFRRSLAWGGNVFLTMIVLMLAVGAATIHFLARPHIFTLLAWVFALALLEGDRRRPGPAVWWLAPLTLVWTNFHGGFTAMLASLALIAAGRAVEGCWETGSLGRRLRPALRYLALLGACGLASLINPYGWRLHGHIAVYLQSDWIRNVVDEFQSPRFRSEHSLHFEILLFAALMLVPALLARRQVSEALLVVFWAHAALVSARHVPLFVFLAAPLVAGEAGRLWRAWARSRPAKSAVMILEQVSEDLRPGFRRLSLWGPLGLAAVVLATPRAHWPADFPEQKFPVALVHRHQERLAGARVFTTDQWGNYLIYRFYPRQRVFMDGRSDFYGPEIGNQYLRAAHGRSGWSEFLDRWGFEFVLSPSEWPLASLLAQSGEWRLLERDKLAVLYERSRPARGR